MAMLYKAWLDAPNLVQRRHEGQSASNAAVAVEYAAAQKIQCWWRGYVQRMRIEGMRRDVLLIQRNYRAFKGRLRFKDKMLSTLGAHRLRFYNRQALVIQRHWRGFWSRRHMHDFYQRKRFIEAIKAKNEEIRHVTREQLKNKTGEEEFALDRVLQTAGGKHYLLSTETIRGVYNPPQGPKTIIKHVGVLEDKIRSANNALVKRQPRPQPLSRPPSTKTSPLPPPAPPHWHAHVANKGRIQGPFKPVQEVWAQRVKGYKPTLRVATSHSSVQDMRIIEKNAEWTKRIHEARFNATIDPKYPYVPSIHTSTEYGHIGYGTKTFRSYESAPRGGQDLWVGPQSFRGVVSPIPIFDEYDTTVS